MATAETVEALKERLTTGSLVAGTGPMAEGEERAVELPETWSVETREADVAGLGRVTVVEVHLNMEASTYRFLNDPDNPQQRSPAEAIYRAMDEAGISRPDETPELGVQVGVGSDRGTVLVQGYLPVEGGEAQPDGGVALPVIETGMTLTAFLSAMGGVGMARLLTNWGEEYTVKNNLDTATFDIGIYDDSSAGATGDAVADTTDLAGLTTEPATGNYTRQVEAMSAADLSGNWGADTDTDTVFDLTNTTGVADSWLAEVSFTAVESADGASTPHLLCTGALSQQYDLGNLTQLTLSAGGVGWTIN